MGEASRVESIWGIENFGIWPGTSQVSRHVSCGSGFPAATIEAESLSHKKQN
jgi:hypothetical protein